MYRKQKIKINETGAMYSKHQYRFKNPSYKTENTKVEY